MVALRGAGSSLNSSSHPCVQGHSNQTQYGTGDASQNLQTPLNMPPSVAQHMNANQINMPPLNNISLQFVHQTNPSSLKHEQSSTSRFSNANNCSLPSSHHYRLLNQSTNNSSYPRATTPVHRTECYHPAGVTGASTYMPNTPGGAQSSAPTALRVQTTPQQQAPQAPQDMSKTTMSGHTFVPGQNPGSQTPRPPYQNFQYRQHGTRPSSHPRQQQAFMPGASASASGPVMYHHHPALVFQPTPMGLPQSFQQAARSQGYYPYMAPYINYNNPPSHTPPYYFPSNGQQLPSQNLQTNPQGGGRNNPTTLVGPQGTPATATAPAVSLSHPQAQPTHMHQSMSGNRPYTKRISHRIPIIDPISNREVVSEENESGDSSERQTPQPETSSIAEEFARRVIEVAKQPSNVDHTLKSNFQSKNVETPVTTASSVQLPSNTVNSTHNSLGSIVVNETKNAKPDVGVEHNETPVVSAISNSPVIVPKMPLTVKQIQKGGEQTVQPTVETSKVLTGNNKQKKNKPVVPQTEGEKMADVLEVNASVVTASSTTPTMSTLASAPQPQRIREPRDRHKSEEKSSVPKESVAQPNKEVVAPSASIKTNGPTLPKVISSVENINPPTSQSSQCTETSRKQTPPKQTSLPDAPSISETKSELSQIEPNISGGSQLTATELLSASIEKLSKETSPPDSKNKEGSTASQAQAKLTQSIASCIRTNLPEPKMKDNNLNAMAADADTANGNTVESPKVDNVKDDDNKNEKCMKNLQNKIKKTAIKTNVDMKIEEPSSCKNGNDETDKVSQAEPEIKKDDSPSEKAETSTAPPQFVPKYVYAEDQWSPINKTGKKIYDIMFLKQVKDNPLSKDKPNVRLLEELNVMRTTPMQEHFIFQPILRPNNDSLFPPFVKLPGMGSRSNTLRDTKKDGRSMGSGGKGSMKLTPSGNSSSQYKPVIHMSIPSSEHIKLNETENAWKPSRLKRDCLSQEDIKTQELYNNFRGILNKLTPQKFETLMKKVKNLEINNQTRLEGVIDLVFEKAIDEPNFSETYANMCTNLALLKVPSDNSPDQCVNFRALIINKCQNQFVKPEMDEKVIKLEKEISECTDPVKKKELQLQLDEENRRIRMRSVGNVRFIGELYKLKMLTSKIMVFCMNHLIEKLEEEKLECLCKLLTTIGQQIESEAREQLVSVFNKMQDIVDKKSNKISSRVRFMIQDVIVLRKKQWQVKNVVDSQPKTMDQIQKEAEQQHRHIELMNSNPMGGGFRREDGGRGKRGEGRRQNNSFMDNQWKTKNSYTVDTSKLKAAAAPKNITSIKLAPQNCGWNHGSSTKNTVQAASNSMNSLTKSNIYSVLENVQMDPTSLRGNKESSPSYHSKGASIERSTFNSRGDFTGSGGGRSGSMGVERNAATAKKLPTPPPEIPQAPPAAIAQEPLPEAKKKSVKSMIDLSLINPDDKELAQEFKHLFAPQHHASVIFEILNIALEKSSNELNMIAKSLLHLVATNTITADIFVDGLNEVLDFAPDLYIDVPMLYDNLGLFIAPQIEKKHITFAQILRPSKTVISSNQGHLLLKAIIKELKNSMGPSFVKTKWQESGLKLNQWMNQDQVSKWLDENQFEFLEGIVASDDSKKILTPTETQSKLLQLMNADESNETIKGWIQDNFGKATNEDWFMRALTQAMSEHALFGAEGRDVPHFSQDRMGKYSELLLLFGGDSKEEREASCLFGIQQLIHRLEHPQGLTLELFQYLHEQYIISVEGFIAWEETDKEPEGKAVMLKALTSFFTNIKEADNEESGSED